MVLVTQATRIIAIAAAAGLVGSASGQLEGPKVDKQGFSDAGPAQGRRGGPERGAERGQWGGRAERGERTPTLSAFRSKFDIDADGKLSAGERETLDVALPVYAATLTAPHDTDGDGLLSKAEWDGAVEVLGLELSQRAARAEGAEGGERQGRGARGGMRDRARDGAQRGGNNQERRAAMLKRFDADGDGELSQDERAAARTQLESQRYTTMLERIDADGNGVITAAEVADANVKIAERAAKAAERGAERGERGQRGGERRARPGRGPVGGEDVMFPDDV